jgi:hypothetical protein
MSHKFVIRNEHEVAGFTDAVIRTRRARGYGKLSDEMSFFHMSYR